jgi:hypothetical protein
MKFLFVVSFFLLYQAAFARPSIPGQVPDDVLERLGVRPGYQLPLQMIGPDNSVTLPDGTPLSLHGLSPHSVFSSSAKCYQDDAEIPCPKPTVFTKTENGLKIHVSMDGAGNIQSIVARERNGVSQSLQAVAPGVLTHIPDDAVDEEFSRRFVLQHEMLHDRLRRRLRSQVNAMEQEHRQLQGCTAFREIEVAIAAESTFCAAVGSRNIDSVVNSILADVSFEYQMDGLCMTAVVSHYEKYCRPNSDPYKDGVTLNLSGCGNNGLLQFFQSYWNTNRQDVERDVAELFSGTSLETLEDGRFVVGCAYVEQTCSNLSASYGINYVSYTSNVVARSNLVAHEIGHTLGKSQEMSLLGHDRIRCSCCLTNTILACLKNRSIP